MKGCFSFIIASVFAVVFAIVAWIFFDSSIKGYVDLADSDPASLAERHQNAKQGDAKPISTEEAAARAGRDIATGKKLQNAGAIKIGTYRIITCVVCGTGSFAIYWLFIFLTHIIKKPLEGAFDSPVESFSRNTLQPIITATLGGAFVSPIFSFYAVELIIILI